MTNDRLTVQDLIDFLNRIDDKDMCVAACIDIPGYDAGDKSSIKEDKIFIGGVVIGCKICKNGRLDGDLGLEVDQKFLLIDGSGGCREDSFVPFNSNKEKT